MDGDERLPAAPSLAVAGPAAIVARLVARMVGTVVAATFLAFVVLEMSIPGGFRAVILPPGDSRSPRARRLIDAYHLDDPLIVRYGHWLVDAVRGDFGRSAWSGEPVTDIITHRLPITAELMFVGVFLTVGQMLGMLSHFDIRSLGWGPELVHHVAEAAQNNTIVLEDVRLVIRDDDSQ